MLKLKNYSFSGIGRFVQKQNIDLESRDHLIQIDGENSNTGGSSGAGKSTTVEALAYLLGISDIPSTQLQSRITKSPIWVEGQFEGDITITRSKKDGLSINTPEGTVSGNSKLAEEKLDEIIGVNRKLLKTMCYKRQKQGGFFLNLTPKESHDFLIDCLDLGQYQEKIDIMSNNLKDKYKPRKIELESGVVEIKHTIEQLNDYLSKKEEPKKQSRDGLPAKEELELQLDVLNQSLENEKNNYQTNIESIGPKPVEAIGEGFEKDEEIELLSNKISEVVQQINSNIAQKNTDIEQMTSAIYKIQKRIDDTNALKEKQIANQKEASNLFDQKEHLLKGNCPTCKQDWMDEDALQKVKDRMFVVGNELKEWEEKISQVPHLYQMLEKAKTLLANKNETIINEKEENTLEVLKEQKRVLENERDNFQNVHKQKYLEELNAWKNKFDAIDVVYREKEKDITANINKLKNEISTIEMANKSYEEALAVYKKDIEAINSKISIFQKDLESKDSELEELSKKVILSEESIRLIKNFTLQKFQDTLDYIGQRSTEIINQIPNMSNAVIFFENAKETKAGKIKNEVSAIINLEGDSGVPIKTLSGGERTSADFAIDLAVGEMIESMTQKGVNFLIIDEGFDGLDSISKIQCLEILKTLNTDKKILMVDHSSEVKEMVCDIIKVTRINEESFIQ